MKKHVLQFSNVPESSARNLLYKMKHVGYPGGIFIDRDVEDHPIVDEAFLEHIENLAVKSPVPLVKTSLTVALLKDPESVEQWTTRLTDFTLIDRGRISAKLTLLLGEEYSESIRLKCMFMAFAVLEAEPLLDSLQVYARSNLIMVVSRQNIPFSKYMGNYHISHRGFGMQITDVVAHHVISSWFESNENRFFE